MNCRRLQLRCLATAGFILMCGARSPGEPALEETNSGVPCVSSAVPPEIDQALRRSQAALDSTNLLPAENQVAEQPHLEVARQKLELAQAQRREKLFEQAQENLSAVLASQATPQLQRSALLEMALLAQDSRQLARAQQVYAHFVEQFRDDPGVPEVLLRQGLLYREMGAPALALSKFYAVMSSALTLKLDRLAYYQRLVLQAQTEIADTYYLAGRFEDAADYFKRLLKLENPSLNREQILGKLVRSFSAASRYPEAVAQARLFLGQYPASEQVPEVRFLLADALKHMGHQEGAMREVLGLLRAEQTVADQKRESWLYWQQRAGNELANQLYESGNYVEALEIYLRLGDLNELPQWRLPAWYQAGLIYERLRQPEKAATLYGRISETGKTMKKENQRPASLQIVLEMAEWRRSQLAWQTKAEMANRQLSLSTSGATNISKIAQATLTPK